MEHQETGYGEVYTFHNGYRLVYTETSGVYSLFFYNKPCQLGAETDAAALSEKQRGDLVFYLDNAPNPELEDLHKLLWPGKLIKSATNGTVEDGNGHNGETRDGNGEEENSSLAASLPAIAEKPLPQRFEGNLPPGCVWHKKDDKWAAAGIAGMIFTAVTFVLGFGAARKRWH